jgi:predicted transcriptional regulator
LTNQKVLILSIKPEFVEQIFNGTKTIELRKVMPSVKIGDTVIVYCTVPVKAIVGICKINNILQESPLNIWSKYSNKLGVTDKQFWEYYKNSNKSVGIFLEGVCKLDFEIPLSEIKKLHPTFQPPQCFKYISRLTALKSFKQLTSQ